MIRLRLLLFLRVLFVMSISEDGGESGMLASALRMPPLTVDIKKRQMEAEQLCQECQDPIYSLGLNTYRVPMALHGLNRARLVRSLLEKLDDDGKSSSGSGSGRGVILLEGGKQTTRYDTDCKLYIYSSTVLSDECNHQ